MSEQLRAAWRAYIAQSHRPAEFDVRKTAHILTIKKDDGRYCTVFELKKNGEIKC